MRVLNHMRRTDKLSERSTESAITLISTNNKKNNKKQQNGRNHHIPVNINTNINGLNSPIKANLLANWIKKEVLNI
jgi:hypothetical protein